jgi:hypothetical protein
LASLSQYSPAAIGYRFVITALVVLGLKPLRQTSLTIGLRLAVVWGMKTAVHSQGTNGYGTIEQVAGGKSQSNTTNLQPAAFILHNSLFR